MFRMSQKLLILNLLLVLFLVSSAWSFKLKFSLEKGSDDVHLRQPFTAFFDQNNLRLYIADTGNNRLVSYELDGTPLKEFDAAGQLKGPIAMIRDDQGNLWVVERPLNSLTFIDLKAHRLERHQIVYQGNPVLIDRLIWWSPYLMLLDRTSGKVLALDKNLNIRRVIAPENSNFRGFIDFKIKGDTLWGLENITGRIFAINLKNNQEKTIYPQIKTVLPISIEIDNQENLYILDRDLKKVFVFDKNGHLRYSFLKEGFQPGQVRYPWQLLFVKSNLLVVDEGNGRVDVWGH